MLEGEGGEVWWRKCCWGKELEGNREGTPGKDGEIPSETLGCNTDSIAVQCLCSYISRFQSLEQVQNLGMRVILAKPPRTPSAPLRDQLRWTTLYRQCHNALLCQVHRCMLNQAPSYLSKKFVKNACTYSSIREQTSYTFHTTYRNIQVLI